MRLRPYLLPAVVLPLLLVGCSRGSTEESEKGKSSKDVKAASHSEGAVQSFEVESDGPDRVGSTKLEPDGKPDVVFIATLEGDVHGLILTNCPDGKHIASQWDTLAKGDAVPRDFSFKDGGQTWWLGVANASGEFLNDEDSRLEAMKLDKPTKLQLHVAQNGKLQADAEVCLTVLDEDGKIVGRATTTM